MKYDYNPFDKPFEEIRASNLEVLRTVAEGWYVEYKREMPNASAVAKSVTAFANTYGGWLFYGIEEKSKDDAVAGGFLGIPYEEADGALQRVRQAVAGHSQPSPYFRIKALMGPVQAIGLPENRCVIMAQVPWGPEAPYIHKDGRIYRRVGDGSEPRPENDRFILDQLWSRSIKITQQYADWIGRELETSKAERNSPYVRLFFIADFWRDHNSMNGITLQRVREVMSDVKKDFSIPFQSVYQTSGGFVCRQTANNDPEVLGLTWKLGENFQSEVIIPISKFHYDNLDDLRDWFKGYKHIDRFIKLCEKQRYLQPTVIDLNILFYVLLGIALIQTALAKEFDWTGPVYAKIEISGVWRTIPFFDTNDVLDEFEKHGLPLSLRDKIPIFAGTDQSSFIELDGPLDDNLESHRIKMASKLFVFIAVALGIRPSVDQNGDFSNTANDFFETGMRALQAQDKRTQRGNS